MISDVIAPLNDVAVTSSGASQCVVVGGLTADHSDDAYLLIRFQGLMLGGRAWSFD